MKFIFLDKKKKSRASEHAQHTCVEASCLYRGWDENFCKEGTRRGWVLLEHTLSPNFVFLFCYYFANISKINCEVILKKKEKMNVIYIYIYIFFFFSNKKINFRYKQKMSFLFWMCVWKWCSDIEKWLE